MFKLRIDSRRINRNFTVRQLSRLDAGSQTLIRVGFPQYKICRPDQVSACLCHLESNEARFSTGGYFCPTCNAKYCELPIECKVCGLTLVMAPHLARSYHHLFPLDPFAEISNETKNIETEEVKPIYENCYGCQHPISTEKTVFQCKSCKNIYCIECDIFIHETLHSCPSCSNPLN